MNQNIEQLFEINSPPKTITTSDIPIVTERGSSASTPAFTTDGTKPLAQVQEQIDVYTSPGVHSRMLLRLEVNAVVEFHKLWKRDGGWVEMRMHNGMMGYISSKTKIAFLKRVKLKESEVDIFSQPFSDGESSYKLVKGNIFWMFESAEASAPSWTVARLDSGQQGYIPSSTKVKTLPQITYPLVETAGHDVLVGAIWCIGGIAVTVGTYSAVAETGGTYLICWGAVIFGGLQFLRGLFRAAVAEQPTNYGDQGTEVPRTVSEYSGSAVEDNTIKTHNCLHCGTQGVLLMSDGRCPNCKKYVT